MEDQPPAPASAPLAHSPQLGLAIASLVLGILAVVLSLFVVGAILGVVGLLLGVIHIRSRRGTNVMAWWGVGLSIAGVVAGLALGFYYYRAYQEITAAMESGGRDEGADVESWEGALAPDITVKDLDGQTLQLSQLRGKRVILDFWATWCPPCVKEIPHFIQLINETSRDELVIVGISSETEATLKAFVKKRGINYPIAAAKDNDLPAPYSDIHSIPTTFFIDRNGVIQAIRVGYHDFAAIRELALAADWKGEPKPAPSSTASKSLDDKSPAADE